MIWYALAGCLLVIFGSGVVLGAGLGLTGFAVLQFFSGTTAAAVPAVWNLFTDFTLSAVPIFLFLGEILMKSGVSERLYNALTPLFHRLPGRLLHTNVWACAVFGAVNGSSSATAAAIGSVAYPELARRGYDRAAVVGSLAGAGTLGLIIPPSLSLLLYGALTDTSIGRLFLAGIVPGVMIAVFFSIYIIGLALARPTVVPTAEAQPSFQEAVRALGGIWPLPILIAAVLGPIYLGIATPTESAGFGVAVALILGIIWGDLTWRSIASAFFVATKIYGMLCFVIVGTVILAQGVANVGLPQRTVEQVATLGMTKYQVLLVVVFIYFVLGCFFDGVSMMIMTLPMVFPLMTKLGFDAVWLGVIITLLIEIGAITPPVGVNLFVISAITRQTVTLEQAALASAPYWLILLAAIAVLTVSPEIVLFLPRFLD